MRALILGGAKSGKSSLAQSLCFKLTNTCNRYYWATMEPVDNEDMARIKRHIEDRDGLDFQTIEKGRDILDCPLPQNISSGGVLFDSITAYLGNEMFHDNTVNKNAGELCTISLLKLSLRCGNFIAVCDDMWQDGLEYEETTVNYAKSLALICRRLAKEFDIVCEMAAGVPNVLKGRLSL